MLLAVRQMREKIESNMRALLALDIDENLREAFKEWLEYKDDGEESRKKSEKVLAAIEEMTTSDSVEIGDTVKIGYFSQENIRDAVDSGYWNLYRYNPDLKKIGRNPFTLDSDTPTASFRDFIMGQVRYSSLAKEFPDIAEKLYEMTEEDARQRYEGYRKLADMD